MTTKDEALKLALEALLSCSVGDYSTGHVIHPSFDVDAVNKAIEAIDALAEQPAQQQEPVAVVKALPMGNNQTDMHYAECQHLPVGTLLYTSPPASKPLTMQARTSIVRANTSFHDKNEIDAYGIIDDVEAAHGIKENT